ncbi:unnamed protein product [Camellia sinensis]
MGTVIDSHFLALTALVTVGYQFIFFLITALLKFDKVTDFAGSTNFIILAVLTVVLKGTWHFRQSCLVIACSNMGSSSGTISIDERFYNGEKIDALMKCVAISANWQCSGHFSAVWVWTVSLPVTIVNASDRNPSIQAQDIIGWIMWSIGIIIEATADQQKLNFKNFPENRGKWCSVGVWKYSRHPNYFGERPLIQMRKVTYVNSSGPGNVAGCAWQSHLKFLDNRRLYLIRILLWWGIFVASTPVLKGADWLVILGPLFLTLLLLFVSGIPLLEVSADKKFGNVAGYRVYKSTTSPLIPLPPVVYGNLPSWFKKAFLFEFPMYNRNLPQEGQNWICIN